jgi:hypothetical protein
MAKEKQPVEPEVVPAAPPLSQRTLDEMDFGKSQAAENARAMERAEKARVEQK